MSHYIETYTGKCFYLTQPSMDMVCIEDIAHSLSNTCRFGGHTQKHYTVAEHCVMMARRHPDPRYALGLLLHDAGEAYYGDLPTPMKRVLGDVYTDMRYKIDWTVYEALGVDALMTEETVKQIIHSYDLDALFWEAYHLMVSKSESLTGHAPSFTHLKERWPAPECWDQRRAELEFLVLYRYLKDKT